MYCNRKLKLSNIFRFKEYQNSLLSNTIKTLTDKIEYSAQSICYKSHSTIASNYDGVSIFVLCQTKLVIVYGTGGAILIDYKTIAGYCRFVTQFEKHQSKDNYYQFGTNSQSCESQAEQRVWQIKSFNKQLNIKRNHGNKFMNKISNYSTESTVDQQVEFMDILNMLVMKTHFGDELRLYISTIGIETITHHKKSFYVSQIPKKQITNNSDADCFTSEILSVFLYTKTIADETDYIVN